jgi:cytoskeletal protein RodZ
MSTRTASTSEDSPGVAADLAALRPARLTLSELGHIGEALRDARQSLGMELDDIAQATHIRASYLAALEGFALDGLPARPFAVGYLKAYARALGIDQDAAVERFRREAPEHDDTLRAPLGSAMRRQGRLRSLAGAVLVIVLGYSAWNLAVRLRTQRPRAVVAAAALPSAPRLPNGPAILGAPLPAPPEATTPPPYVTPGLAAATAAKGPTAAAEITARIAADAQAARPANAVISGAPFMAHGTVFGASHGTVIIQAVEPLSLVVRGGSVVYFARQLAAGEAWRAPSFAGLVVDVDVPAAAEVYVSGKAIGPLTAGRTPVAALQARAANP